MAGRQRLETKVDEACQTVASLVAGSRRSPSDEVPVSALEELSVTLEEIEVATEELRQQNEELAEARHTIEVESARYRGLFEEAPASSVVTDRHGTVREANQSALVFLGVERRWLVDKPLMVFVVPAERRRLRLMLLNLRPDGHVLGAEFHLRPRRRTPVTVSIDVAAVTDDDGSQMLHWHLRDISDHRHALQSMELAIRREQEAAERVRSIDAVRTALVEATVHDLRTPLTTIVGFADLLDRFEQLDPATIHQICRRLTVNARRLDRIVSELMEVDRLAPGQAEAKREAADVGEIVRRIAGEWTGLDHSVEVDAESLTFPVDVAKVERIVDNLMANAIKHTAAGGAVWVRIAADREGILIVVEDSGGGIPDAVKEDVFMAFVRADPEHAGTGLGLHIVSRFAEMHGGRAWVEDRPGGGASFRVWLGPPPEPVSITEAPERSDTLGVAFARPDGRWFWVSDGLCDLLGRPRQSLIGVDLSKLVLAATPAEAWIARGRLLSGAVGTARYELAIGRPDGSTLWVDVSGSRVTSASGDHLVEHVVDASAWRETIGRLAYAATHDSLTGLPNRLMVLDRLDRALRHHERGPARVGVLYIDLNKFKSVNDRWGHAMGDDVLRAIATRLTSAVREDETVGRIGGDEFVVVIEQLAKDEAIGAVVDRIRGAFAEPFDVGNRRVRVTASIGVVRTDGTGRRAVDVLAEADAMMFANKPRRRSH